MYGWGVFKKYRNWSYIHKDEKKKKTMTETLTYFKRKPFANFPLVEALAKLLFWYGIKLYFFKRPPYPQILVNKKEKSNTELDLVRKEREMNIDKKHEDWRLDIIISINCSVMYTSTIKLINEHTPCLYPLKSF